MIHPKKLLLLGGLRYLIPVIEAAHRQGYYVITCDYLPNNLLLFLICIPFRKKGGKRTYGFGRIGGALFLSLYIAYLVFLGVTTV